MRVLHTQAWPLALLLAPTATAMMARGSSSNSRLLGAFMTVGGRNGMMTAFECRGISSRALSRSAISSRAPLALTGASFWGRKEASPFSASFSSSSSSSSSSSLTALHAVPPQIGDHPVRTQPPSVSKIEAVSGAGSDFTGDMLVLPVFQPEDADAKLGLSELLAAWDAKMSGALADLIEQKEFKGKAGSSVKVRLGGSSPAKTVVLVGLGKSSALKPGSFASLGSALASEVKAEKPKTVGVILPTQAADADLQSAVEEFHVGLYQDNRYKTGEGVVKMPEVQSVRFFGGAVKAGDKAVATGTAFAEGMRLTKDLVNAPPNYVFPKTLADTARDISKEHGLELKVLGQEECFALKMGAYLGVAQGSVHGPEFIHLTYKPKSGEAKKRLVLIGKGLTFDSGGYNLKAGAGSMIELMKFDMGGAGAVLGAAKAIGQLQPAGVEVHIIVAACENMISEKAYRPGDILTASNGKTIEVGNTDAEGRLTLADALVYAEALKPDAIVDSATLTGACIIALGGDYGGLWSSNDELASAIEASAKSKGEKLWRMPLAEEYRPNIKSDIADLKNVGGREGGSITAALFLSEFVKSAPWAHLDIAGPVWNGKKGGATGYGVRTLTQWVLNHSSSSSS